jgi:hypothetical protein
MKKLLIPILLFLASCNSQPYYNQYPNDYQVMTSPTGQQMVVINNGGRSYLMDYLLFTNLMNSGGYTRVYNYYHSYPSSITYYNPSSYSNWRSTRMNSSSFRSNTPSTGSGFRSVNNNPSGFRSNNSSSNSVFSTPTQSSGSGFRSSSSSSSGFRSSSSSSSGFRSSSSSGFGRRR